MPAPEDRRHRGRRQEVADQNLRPGERAQHRLGEEHAGEQEPELEDDEQQHDAEAEARVALRDPEQARGAHPDDQEGEHVHPGEAEHHLEVDGQRLGQLEAGAAAEEGGAEDGRGVEGAPLHAVQREEPEGDRRGADHPGEEAFGIDGGGRGGLPALDRSAREPRLGGHDALLSRCCLGPAKGVFARPLRPGARHRQARPTAASAFSTRPTGVASSCSRARRASVRGCRGAFGRARSSGGNRTSATGGTTRRAAAR